ncbi:2Fe-2S ferredoxin [Novosphingobium kunmingense]|uniref:2Fe-2S ferredoxin n=1 Tax=Novosphingobium kunmingense TaxID=1211806 RepID=A0A2N0H773_9SPHN|nr:2Fe-2S iron-sulfur cluster-binding protein [Novosphingobium kunmingense]PKB14791.1 2Fe-2S ferredoxin [Novosphingobium kunmingense]
MVRVRYRTADGIEGAFDASPGLSLMASAKAAGIDGIEAECGGSMVCATCQVYVAEAWLSTLEPPSEMEAEMVEYTRHPRPNSRLSCQIVMSEALDGIEIELPPSQR